MATILLYPKTMRTHLRQGLRNTTLSSSTAQNKILTSISPHVQPHWQHAENVISSPDNSKRFADSDVLLSLTALQADSNKFMNPEVMKPLYDHYANFSLLQQFSTTRLESHSLRVRCSF
jgi:hypothetical protein